MTLAILDRLCAGRSDTRVIHQKNQGQVAATNAGVRATTLPWLKLVDGDDVLVPYATRILLDAAVSIDAKIAPPMLVEPLLPKLLDAFTETLIPRESAES